MIKPFRSLALTAVAVISVAAIAEAQTAAEPPGSVLKTAGPLTPLKVQVVISRFQGEKKVSSLPYMISVNANDGRIDPLGQYIPHGGPARLRVGLQVPIIDIVNSKDAPGGQKPTGSVRYRNVGTNIDCMAHSVDGGRFRLTISIEDTSVYAEGQTADGLLKLDNVPSFRSFQSSNSVILKIGESTQFTAATDRISGEVTRVDVTLMEK